MEDKINEMETIIFGVGENRTFSASGFFGGGQPKNKNIVKVIAVGKEVLLFENDWKLESEHSSDCCENHYLSFGDISIKDFEGMEFDLTKDEFFEKVPEYGIRLRPLNDHPVSVPGYGYNNGYYSTNLTLVVTGPDDYRKEYDVEECQIIEG